MELLKKIKVRAVLLDENDYMALMYLPKFEFNNYNDLYMLPGGSIETNENFYEMIGLAGYVCKVIHFYRVGFKKMRAEYEKFTAIPEMRCAA